MYIHEILWDDYRIEHIAHHNVDPHEVEEVCDDSLHIARREGQNRYRLYGQTKAGRYLFIVIENVKGTVYRAITARDMTPREKQSFRKLR